jgi:restriction endonuclease S subunit
LADNNGIYEFITNSDYKKMNFYDLDDENLFICKVNASKIIFKTKIKYYKGKCSYSSLMYRLIPKIRLNLKFYYYYLNLYLSEIEKYNKGLANKVLDKEKLMVLFKIPLPDLATQQQIVDYCDANQNLIEHLEQNIKINEELSKNFLEQILS